MLWNILLLSNHLHICTFNDVTITCAIFCSVAMSFQEMFSTFDCKKGFMMFVIYVRQPSNSCSYFCQYCCSSIRWPCINSINDMLLQVYSAGENTAKYTWCSDLHFLSFHQAIWQRNESVHRYNVLTFKYYF